MADSIAPSLSIPIRDQSATQVDIEDPKALQEIINGLRQDLMTLAWALQKQGTTLYFSAMGKVACPATGALSLYATCDTAFAVSGVNYWTFQGTRSGAAESTIVVTSSAVPIVAYQEFFLGQFIVSKGNIMSLTLTATGAPAALLITNLVVRCELTPRSPING